MELIQAKQLAQNLVARKNVEWVALDQALGRVLGKTLTAPWDLPRETRSKMDGFALRSVDAQGASSDNPAILQITSELIAAGHEPQKELESGQCVRILTGACLPHGADAVIPEEMVLKEQNSLIVKQNIPPGKWVSLPGNDIRQGELLGSKGLLLTPTRLALIAAFGHAQIPVYQQPRVALLATGDEVREVGAFTKGPYTTCNNRHLLAWLVRLQGGVPFSLGIAEDDPDFIANRLKECDADLVITTGGTGRGERDFILQAWKKSGIEVVFRQINLSPGKNSGLGVRGNHIFCALSGSPWAAQVIFEEILYPLLWKWQGIFNQDIPMIPATLNESIKKKKGNYKAIYGQLHLQTFPPSFTPLPKGENSLFTLLEKRTAYTLVDCQVERIPSGSIVAVHPHDFPLQALPCTGSDFTAGIGNE